MSKSKSLTPDPEKLREELLRVDKNKMVRLTMDVLVASQQTFALAKKVLARSLEEEQASPVLYEFMLESAKAKGELSLPDLLTQYQECLPAFIQEEISRQESEKATRELASAARNRKRAKQNCRVTIGDTKIELPPGHLLLVIGSSREVVAVLDSLRDNPANYCYLGDDEGPVTDDEILSFNHRAEFRSVPLMHWGNAAATNQAWDRLWQDVGGSCTHLFLSNINLAGKRPSDGSLFQQVKNSLGTLSRWLVDRKTRIVAGAYLQNAEEDYKELLAEYASNRSNVIVHTLPGS